MGCGERRPGGWFSSPSLPEGGWLSRRRSGVGLSEGRAGGWAAEPSPPGRFATTLPQGGGRGLGHDSSPPACAAVGEGAGRPGLARCFDSFTVSTKQTCPARPFSTRHPGSGPEFGPDRIIRRGHCCPRRGRDMAQPAVRSIGARRASRSHPSTSARTPEVSIPRASSLDHSPPTSGRWIRRPPHRRDGQESDMASSHDG